MMKDPTQSIREKNYISFMALLFIIEQSMLVLQ